MGRQEQRNEVTEQGASRRGTGGRDQDQASGRPFGPRTRAFSRLLHVGPIDAPGGLPEVELARRKVLLHLLSGRLDEPGVIEYVLALVGGGEAADVLFLHHVP